MIKITDKYYIDSTTHCYTLKEKIIVQKKDSKNFGKETFTDIGYYPTIEGCLKGFLKTATRAYIGQKTENSMQELLQEVKRLGEIIEKINNDMKGV